MLELAFEDEVPGLGGNTVDVLKNRSRAGKTYFHVLEKDVQRHGVTHPFTCIAVADGAPVSAKPHEQENQFGRHAGTAFSERRRRWTGVGCGTSVKTGDVGVFSVYMKPVEKPDVLFALGQFVLVSCYPQVNFGEYFTQI